MKHLLIHYGAYARLKPLLAAFEGQVKPWILSDKDKITDDEGASPLEEGFDWILAEAEMFWSPEVFKFLDVVENGRKLEWIQSSAAGLDHMIFDLMFKNCEVMTRAHVQSDGIAEYVLWAGLDYFQKGPDRRLAQANKKWTRVPVREISCTKWLVYGFGSIGQAIGQRLMAFGAEVTGVKRSPIAIEGIANDLVAPADVSGLLGKMDAIVLCCPYTKETDGLADKAFFEAMKSDALFINVGRGKLVDEKEMLNALNKGQIGGVYSDVFETEPLPEDSPVWTTDNLTATAHCSAFSDDAYGKFDLLYIENMRRQLAGEEMLNRVEAHHFE